MPRLRASGAWSRLTEHTGRGVAKAIQPRRCPLAVISGRCGAKRNVRFTSKSRHASRPQASLGNSILDPLRVARLYGKRERWPENEYLGLSCFNSDQTRRASLICPRWRLVTSQMSPRLEVVPRYRAPGLLQHGGGRVGEQRRGCRLSRLRRQMDRARTRLGPWGERGRERTIAVAALMGADASDVALIASVSAAAGLVAAQFGPGRAGQNVVIGEREYSSNHFPWRLLAGKGYEVRQVPFRNGGLEPDDVARHVDGRTAGRLQRGPDGDRASLRHRGHQRACPRVGALVFVDGSQLVGALAGRRRARGSSTCSRPRITSS